MNNKNIVTKEVMKKIHKGEVKMKPKVYFVLGSVFAGIGFAVAFSFSSLTLHAIYLRLYALSRLGVEGLGWKWIIMFVNFFPWGLMLWSIGLMLLGLYLVRQYDFGYRTGLMGIVIAMVAALMMTTWLLDQLGVVRHLRQQPMLHQFYQDQEVPRGLNEWRRLHGSPAGAVRGVRQMQVR